MERAAPDRRAVLVGAALVAILASLLVALQTQQERYEALVGIASLLTLVAACKVLPYVVAVGSVAACALAGIVVVGAIVAGVVAAVRAFPPLLVFVIPLVVQAVWLGIVVVWVACCVAVVWCCCCRGGGGSRGNGKVKARR